MHANTLNGSLLALPVSDRDHVQGPSAATVTLVEYGDYQCKHCHEAYLNLISVREIMGTRMRFVFRNFPISKAHPNAQLAAEAAEAAGAQGKFWDMHDYLFEHRSHLEVPALVQYAQTVHLDVDRFQNDLQTRAFAARVREDVHSGVRSGVSTTPTFFINGVRHDGPWDLQSLTTALVTASKRSVD
jgi:protein-disulfide isomerase